MSYTVTAALSEPRRLLFIFKNIEMGQVIRQLMQTEFTVKWQQSETATNQIDVAEVDVVLTDGATDTLKMIRSNPALVDLPVMVLLAPSNIKQQVPAFDNGANDVAVMPMPADVLKARVRQLAKSKERSENQQQVINFLKTAYQKKDRFLQIVTHDLKNPVNNIKLAHFYLQGEVEDTQANREALETIDLAVQTMNNLITDFLDSAALETGKTQLKLEPLVMEDLIWEVIARYSETANVKNIMLLMGETEGVILADPNRFMQVMSNLVSNAIKYSPNDRFVTISSTVKGKKVRFMVTDEGPGIPEKEQSALFEPFSKLSPRPTNGESSTGLGLSIVKELVTLHQGKVGVESAENKGCTFWVEMPLHVPEVQTHAVAV